MNIFVLDKDIRLNVRAYIDKHIVKMPLEACQMLFTNMHLTMPNIPPLDPTMSIEDKVFAGIPIYKPTHANHPCTIWARASKQNALWLVDLLEEMRLEAIHRYSHSDDWYHKSHLLLEFFIGENPEWCEHLPDIGLTEFAVCMPEHYKVAGDPFSSYRNYYVGDKRPIASWKNRSKPSWFV